MCHKNFAKERESKPEKLAEIRGFLRRWTGANYPIYISMYLDVLSPTQRLNVRTKGGTRAGKNGEKYKRFFDDDEQVAYFHRFITERRSRYK